MEAKDTSATPLSTFTQLEVSVLDLNDNAPKFSSALYLTEIEENSRLRTSVLQVTASDDDSGVNKQIR